LGKAREFMKKAHSQKAEPTQSTTTEPKTTIPASKVTLPKSRVVSTSTPTPAPVPTQKVTTPAPQVTTGTEAAPKGIIPPAQEKIPTGVTQIARNDVPLTIYGIKPVATNFNCYNKDIFKWLRDFSSNNQFNGGVPVTKSQVIEIALDVLMYDLGINPIGYESQEALREDIQRRIYEKRYQET
jgi:hypothetical protein